MCFLSLALLASLILPACQPAEPPTPHAADPPAAEIDLPRLAEIDDEPTLRVRLRSAAESIQLDDEHRFTLRAGPGERATGHVFQGPLRISQRGTQFRIRDARGQSHTWNTPVLRIESPAGETASLGERAYPGALVLVTLRARNGEPANRFDLVNHVPMEDYLPGVLEAELFGNWDQSAYEAQAIAARSYAFFEMALRRDRHFDLHATVASQVYAGASAHPTARRAVQRTRGQVLIHEGRIVPAFYSSTCGGRSQDATAAFPRHGRTVDIAPLHGGQTCRDCAPATYYRWGPFTRPATDLAQRVAAWGARRDHPVADLQGLQRIRRLDSERSGRPRVFELTDARGRVYPLTAEHFRFAANHQSEQLPTLTDQQLLRSSDVRVELRGGETHFREGRGFGHGVGLCQWGAQGKAAAGQTGRAIAQSYYPRATIERAY